MKVKVLLVFVFTVFVACYSEETKMEIIFWNIKEVDVYNNYGSSFFKLRYEELSKYIADSYILDLTTISKYDHENKLFIIDEDKIDYSKINSDFFSIVFNGKILITGIKRFIMPTAQIRPFDKIKIPVLVELLNAPPNQRVFSLVPYYVTPFIPYSDYSENDKKLLNTALIDKYFNDR